jgi:hypothetical protein
MTTSRMTERTTQELTSLEATLAEIARLTEKAERLKWGILDRREIGAQTAVARVYGVKRQSVKQWIDARAEAMRHAKPMPADDIAIGDLVHTDDGRHVEVRALVRGDVGELTVNPGDADELGGKVWETAKVTRHADRSIA